MITKKSLVDPQVLNRYSYVANRPLVFADQDGLDATVVYSVGNLTREQQEWFNQHKDEIFAAIAAKLKDAGIKNVTFTDAASLSKEDLQKLATAPTLADTRRTGTPGVARLEIVGDQSSFNPQQAPMSVFEQTSHGRAAVFLDRIIGSDASDRGSAQCDAVCGVANVAAHGIGHAYGYDDPAHNWAGVTWPWNYFRQDVMRQGQDPFKAPLPYVKDVNLRAVDEVNRAKRFPE